MDQNDNLEHQTIHQIHALAASTVAVGQGAFQDEIQEKVNNCYKTQEKCKILYQFLYPLFSIIFIQKQLTIYPLFYCSILLI